MAKLCVGGMLTIALTLKSLRNARKSFKCICVNHWEENSVCSTRVIVPPRLSIFKFQMVSTFPHRYRPAYPSFKAFFFALIVTEARRLMKPHVLPPLLAERIWWKRSVGSLRISKKEAQQTTDFFNWISASPRHTWNKPHPVPSTPFRPHKNLCTSENENFSRWKSCLETTARERERRCMWGEGRRRN